MEQPNDKRTIIEWTPYLACAYAEGFCEGENATVVEFTEAWSFIAINKLYLTLQGFYGRTVRNFVNRLFYIRVYHDFSCTPIQRDCRIGRIIIPRYILAARHCKLILNA